MYDLKPQDIKKRLKKQTIPEIAQEIGCHPSNLYQFCKRNKIILPKFNPTGWKWGNLEVIEEYGRDNKQKKLWRCKCKCGKETFLTSTSIKRKDTKSCGCWNYEYRKQHPNWTGYKEISGKIWSKIKKGAISRNLEFNITIEQAYNLFIKQNKKCKLTNLDIKFANTTKDNENGLTTASLDRIDNTKGYTLNNIQWIHKDVNFMKQDYNEKYYIEICKLIAKNNG